jgi:hypothetical protein
MRWGRTDGTVRGACPPLGMSKCRVAEECGYGYVLHIEIWADNVCGDPLGEGLGGGKG